MDNESTKVSLGLQTELAQYGVLRAEAIENAPVKATGTPNFFGLTEGYQESEMLFDTDISAIQDKNMMVSLVAPDNETFDMLVTKDFDKAITTANETTLRAFLRKIIRQA